MNADPTFWIDEPRAKARKTDPATSHEAAHNVEARGYAAAQRLLCYNEVVRCPWQTAAEIARAVGLERHAPSRRLPELRDAGLVVNGVSRFCKVMRTRSMTWGPAVK